MCESTTPVLPLPNRRPESLTPSADRKVTEREAARSASREARSLGEQDEPRTATTRPTSAQMGSRLVRRPVVLIGSGPGRSATLLTALPASLLQQLLVLLLPHLLATLLDERRHEVPFRYSDPNRFRRSTRLAR